MTLPAGIPPAYLPKGTCLGWDSTQIVTQVSADLLIIASCYWLLWVIIRVARQRDYIRTDKRMYKIYMAYACIFFAVGTNRAIEDVAMWLPIYQIVSVVKWVTTIVFAMAAGLIASTLAKGILTREQHREAAVMRGDLLFEQLTAHREAFRKSRQTIQDDISELESLLQLETDKPGSLTVPQMVTTVRDVISELREHLNAG